jgi:hypothetical protein
MRTQFFCLLQATFAAAMLTSARVEATEFRVCIGELDCPVPVDAMFPCGTSLEQAAATVCTIHDNGNVRVSPYRLIPQGQHEGNRCGYAWAKVLCLDN